VKHGGVFDWDSKTWLGAQSARQMRAATQIIYNNTCASPAGALYTGTGVCEDHIDSGRIPGGLGGMSPLGATSDNNISYFEFGYCTSGVTGAVDIKIGFYDNLGGLCSGGLPATPPSLISQAAAYFDLGAPSGFPLPGGSGSSLGCWIVGLTVNSGFCLQSDGDGVFDNVAALDNFSWSFQTENPSSPSLTNGVLIAGDPSASAPGGCTYNLPCGGGGGCGTGLGEIDSFWINVDPSNPTCVSAPPAGSGCYWFGGFPANPYAGLYMRIGSSGACGGCSSAPTSYCTAGTTTNGCTPQMLFTGVASAAGGLGGMLTASNVEGQRSGLIFFGFQQQAIPWSPLSSSFLCVKTPTQRSLIQNSGGVAGQCNGNMVFYLNALVQAQNGMLLGQPVVPGLAVHAQGWFRDPPAPKSTNLTNAITVTFCP